MTLRSLIVLFVVLKLAGVIDWSWWLVLAPLQVYLLLVATLIAAACCEAIQSQQRHREWFGDGGAS